MGLVEYKKKRSFKKTPEPTGGQANKAALRFVIQKHAASRLHYDFRLELHGVLKSWAVPKGPSLNPKDKRLAMLVEDHPYDYKDFEGQIPAGNYGAGTVIIWDEGTYEPVGEATTKTAQEKILAGDFKKGSMKIRISGQKLQGEFAIVKMKGRDENAWLLIKHRDEHASEDDVTEQEQSVISGKTIEELSEDGSTWKSNRTAAKKRAKTTAKKVPARKTITPASRKHADDKKKEKTVARNLLKNAAGKRKKKILKDVRPMLATLVDQPFDDKGWLYEVKWDGFRAISYKTARTVSIRSRNNKDFTTKFYPVELALKDWNVSAVVDGEIVVINESGKPDFNALQGWRSEADGQLIYYVFDLLWLENYDLTNMPLEARKSILRQIIPSAGLIRLSETFDVSGKEFFEQADKLGLEGILAKKADSIYKPDHRSKEWLKIKTIKHQEAIIAGFTKNENSSKKFSALLLGVYDGDNKLQFIGPVGTGFNAEMQTELLKKMKALETAKCPFAKEPDYNKPSRFRPDPPKAEVTWLKPKLVVEVAYRAIGADGGLRHPSFRGLRDDKKATDVRWEEAVTAEEVTDSKDSRLAKKLLTKTDGGDRKTLLNPKDETQVRIVHGHELKFTNLSKQYWPDEGYSKRDMLNYYYQVVPYVMPYMKDRPQTLNRFPNGIKGKSFYQKDVTGKVPSWIETYAYYSEGDERKKHFLVCADEASLLYIASLGCIELNPWSSRTQSPDNPDWCVIDLDPGAKNTFEQVIEAAQVTKQVLDTIELPSFCKTSGSTGLHIYIPLGAIYTYEESKEFARLVVQIVNAQLPKFTTIERKVGDRHGKMYLDFLQNRPQATLAGPYSLRPKPGAPVSMPLHWDEVRKGLKIQNFTIKNAIGRLKETGDLFEGVLGKGVSLDKAANTLETFLEKLK